MQTTRVAGRGTNDDPFEPYHKKSLPSTGPPPRHLGGDGDDEQAGIHGYGVLVTTIAEEEEE